MNLKENSNLVRKTICGGRNIEDALGGRNIEDVCGGRNTQNLIESTCFYLKVSRVHIYFLTLVESACFAMTTVRD